MFPMMMAVLLIVVSVTMLSPSKAIGSDFTIWGAGTVPGTVDSGPDSAVEVGVKFRSDTAGYITGIRFYKASTNTGTHVGNLWTSTGTHLATATFTNETASGWQQVNFSTPVAITADTEHDYKEFIRGLRPLRNGKRTK
jgi:hypothetical protein